MYKRVILKLSGELFGSDESLASLHFDNIASVAAAVKAVRDQGVEVGVVVGAGNIFRSRMVSEGQIDRVAADHMGMMATIINSLALQSALEKLGADARVLSAIPMPEIVEDYVHKRAIKHFSLGRIVIFAGGTGRPFFTTDTTAVIRALEVNAEVVLKASDVDGIYDQDPRENPNAKRFETLTFAEALEKRLRVMDATAFALAQEKNMPIIVFKYSPENIQKVIMGEKLGSSVR